MYNLSNLLSSRVSNETIADFKAQYAFENNQHDLVAFVKECREVERFDINYSASLSSIAREAIAETVQLAYYHVAIFYALAPERSERRNREWNTFFTALRYTMRHPMPQYPQQMLNLLTFCIEASYSTQVSMMHKVQILDLLVNVAPSLEERLALEQRILYIRETGDTYVAPKTKYDIETDRQNVHSTILNSIFRRKLLYLEQHYKITRTFEQYVQMLSKQPLASDASVELFASPEAPVSGKPPLITSTQSHNVRVVKRKSTRVETMKQLWTRFCSLFTSNVDEKQTTRIDVAPKIDDSENPSKEIQVTQPTQKAAWTQGSRWPTPSQEVHELDPKVTEALQHIATCPIEIAPTKLRLRDVFCLVMQRIHEVLVDKDDTEKKETHKEVIQRLKQELSESVGECSTGYCTRLLNVLSGFPSIDIEVVEFYVEEMYAFFQQRVQDTKDEALLDSYISFGEERHNFLAFCASQKMEWKQMLQTKYVHTKQTHSMFLFEEDFKEAYEKFAK